MGADVTAKDKKGISALHYAAGQGRLEVLQYLWSKGLDLDADDPGLVHSTILCSSAGHCQISHQTHGISPCVASVPQLLQDCIVDGMFSSSQGFRFHT